MMQAEDVIKIYKLFKKNGIEVWIDGGWGDVNAICDKFDLELPENYRKSQLH